ncbi:MAG: hypothetical protein NC131_08350 [Roseburia sp.]|nr:hypothetical protein [Roseburia sp.]
MILADGPAGMVHINTAEIPDFRRVELAKGALDLVDLAFATPDAEERYQAWLTERRGGRTKTARVRKTRKE